MNEQNGILLINKNIRNKQKKPIGLPLITLPGSHPVLLVFSTDHTICRIAKFHVRTLFAFCCLLYKDFSWS